MFRRFARVFKATGAFIVASGGVWICYQVHSTINVIHNILHTNVLDYRQKKIEYIYWKDAINQYLLTSMQDEQNVRGSSNSSVFSEVLLRWWISAQKTLAWRLLHIVKIGDKYEKRRAVNALANLKLLSEWDYQMLAQACDAHIAVALSRTKGCDLRFLLKRPKLWHNKKPPSVKKIIENMIRLLQAIENQSHHSCVENFLSTYERKKWRAHSHEDSPGTSLSPLLEDELLRKALDTLTHYCSIDDNPRGDLLLGSLPMLMDLIQVVENDNKMLSNVLSIISYISTFPDALQVFHATGWLWVLAKWSRHTDASLALPCVKSLANLDKDSHDSVSYPQKVFPLYPPFRSNEDHKADIIFVHGLLGTIFITWRQRDSVKIEYPTIDTPPRPTFWNNIFLTVGFSGSDKVEDTKSETPETSHLNTQQYKNQLLDIRKEEFEMLGKDFEYVLADLPTAASRCKEEPYSLPGLKSLKEEGLNQNAYSQCWARDWLPQDCPNVRVLGVNYTSTLSQWFPKCPNQNRAKLADRSIEYMHMLHKVGVGQRPIIWITHSMGGLLVKRMLISAYESENKELHNIFRNTKAIVFFSCPHLGSELADLKMPTELLFWPSLEVQELRYRSASLVDLHLRFLQLLEVSPMTILSFAETKATNVTAVKWPVNFVKPHSADPGVGEFFEIPLDHIDICKPVGRHSFLYRKIIKLIREVLQDN
ncbi:protein SERAC1 isoform X2 [Frankliniella occidentalis]|uniref:Protein SERAC1 n=1 Tax=Frankliniella occidentalis TaxID=133901 RepID=A0A9C6UDG4_FRAOC|nr:protein SERAC1 isoform X2 [Frankliniella occidentalis]